MRASAALIITIIHKSNFHLLDCTTYIMFSNYELHEYIHVCVPDIMLEEAMY